MNSGMYLDMYHSQLSAAVQALCCAEKRQDDNFLFLLEKLRLLTGLSTPSGDN
tara:strand:+ start:6059 stop:6217 length:159 start_codon:yes stop_codon:yes gene_type:complete